LTTSKVALWRDPSRAGDLISVSEFQTVASIRTDPLTVALASLIGFKTNIRGTINRNNERKIGNGVILKASAGYVTFGPDLLSPCYPRGRQNHHRNQHDADGTLYKAHSSTCQLESHRPEMQIAKFGMVLRYHSLFTVCNSNSAFDSDMYKLID
jgi:hypothetical protein